MSGIDVFEQMKADPALARVPVIFATSHDSTALQVIALRKGAADFVTKPLVATQLTSRVRARLRAKLLVEDQTRDGTVPDLPDAPSNLLAPRILIVDDDTASIHILRHTLAAMGDRHFAKSGEEALRLAWRIVPDLILLDAHMPGIDGFDVCRSLKAKYKHVPIAFVTRFSDPRYEKRALDLGAADFIAEPYTGAILQARLRDLLALKRRTDAELQGPVRDGRAGRTGQPPSATEALDGGSLQDALAAASQALAPERVRTRARASRRSAIQRRRRHPGDQAILKRTRARQGSIRPIESAVARRRVRIMRPVKVHRFNILADRRKSDPGQFERTCVAARWSARARRLRDETSSRQVTRRCWPVPGRSTTGRAAQCALATAVSPLRW